MDVTCLQSYFLDNPLLIFNTEKQSYCCQISGIDLDLEKGLKIHSLETKLNVITGRDELDVIEIFKHLGLISELGIENTYSFSGEVSSPV